MFNDINSQISFEAIKDSFAKNASEWHIEDFPDGEHQHGCASLQWTFFISWGWASAPHSRPPFLGNLSSATANDVVLSIFNRS